MTDKIIIYPSKFAQNTDEFWNDIAPLWMYEHWWVLLIPIALVILAGWLSNRK